MKSNFVTSPNPSEGGEPDAVSDKSGGLVKNNFRENVLPPSFGGAGGGQNVEMQANSVRPTSVTSPNPSEGGGPDAVSKNSGGVKLKQVDDNVGRTEAGYITANPHVYPYIKDIREELKNNPTEAEKVIWEYLRAKKTGYKIRRQHIIGNYIADFVCLSKKVIIEIDGKIHLQQKEQDEFRTYALNDEGYKVIRFTNEEVMANPQSVANQIKEILDNHQTTV